MTPTPDTMDLFTEMNLEPAPLPAAFYNSTGIKGAELKQATADATKQDALVLASMTRLRRAGASDVWRDLSEAFLLTSVRRSINGLKERGLVVKTGDRQKGVTKASEIVWEFVAGFVPTNTEDK